MASSAKKQMELKEYEEQKRSGTTEASEAMFSVLKELGQGRPPKTTDISRAIDRINSILEQEERAAVASAAAPSSTATALAATEPVALDETGRRFLANTRNVLEQSKNLLQQRSADDQIQSFLMHSVVAPKQISAAAATSMDDEARKKLQDAQQSLRAIGFHGRKVILLLARSPEFRDSINTLISIAQRLLGKPEVRQEIVQAAKETTAAFGKGGAGQGGVETAPPRAVESVTSTTYHYESSERGKGVAPGASFLTPAHAGTISKVPVDIPIEEESEEEFEEEEEMEEAAQTTTTATTTATAATALSSKIGTTQHEIRYAPKSSGDSSSGALAGSESQSPTQSATGVGGVSQKLSERVQQEVDEDTRKRLQANALVILRTLAANPDHKLAVQSLFQLVSLASSYGFTTATAAAAATAGSATTATDTAATSPSLSQVANEGKEVLSRFADMAVLNSLVHNLRVFITEVREDDESTRLFHKIRRYVEQTLDDPQLLDQAWYRQKASRLLDKVGIWGQRYRQHAALDAALSDWRLLLDGITHDQQLNEFSVALKRWTEDVTYLDTKGKRHLNSQLVAQLRSVFLPIIIEQFHYIPIPAIEDSNETYDWKFENIIFSGYDLLPEHIFIDTDSHTDLKPLSDSQHEMVDSTIEGQGARTSSAVSTRRHHKFGRLFSSSAATSKEEGKEQVVGALGRRVRWPPREKLAPGTTKLSSKTTNHPGPVLTPRGHWRTTGQLVVRAYNIQLAMKNIKFFIRRKSFPRTEQSGLVDVHTKGSKGCKVIIRLDLTSDNMLNTGFFSGGAAEVSIARLAIRIHDSKHNFLFNTLARLISGAIRRRIQKTITENMSEGVKKVLEAVNNAVTNSPGFAQGIVGALKPSKISPLAKQASQLASEAISAPAKPGVGSVVGGGETIAHAS